MPKNTSTKSNAAKGAVTSSNKGGNPAASPAAGRAARISSLPPDDLAGSL
jgi:hypothetical protein